MRNFIEAMSPFASWKKWWGNSRTGELLNVPTGMEHDNYAEENIDSFLPRWEIDEIFNEVGEWWQDVDAWLNAIYESGWQAILWDGSDQSLMLRHQSDTNQTAMLRFFAKKISRQVPIEVIFIDNADGSAHHVLKGRELLSFMKSGKI